MSEKISFEIAAAVKGLNNIRSTEAATKSLTDAVEAQREELKGLNKQLKEADAYGKTKARIAKLGEQLDKTKGQFAALGKQYEAQKTHNAGLRSETRKTEKHIESLKAKMQSAGSVGAQGLNVKLAEAEKQLESLNGELNQGKQAAIELKAAHTKAGKSIGDLTQRKVTQIGKARSLRSELRKAGVSTRDLGDEQRRMAAQADKASANIAKQNARLREMQGIQSRIDGRNGKLSSLGGEAAGLGMKAAPLIGAGFMAMKNESSFSDVKKVVDMSPEEAAALRSWALKTSASKEGGGMSALDIQAMLAAGGQSGIQDLGELKQFVMDSATMGVAFDMEAEQAGETLAVFKASMGLDQKGAMGLAGLANHLSNNSNAQAKDIAAVMAREGASVKTAGFSINEGAALAAALLSNGMGEERSATAMKNIAGRLTLGSAASKSQHEAFSRVGLDAETVAADMQQDATGTLLGVLEAIKRAPIEEQSALMSQIFGEEAKGAVAALAGNTQNLTKALKLARDGEKVHLDSLQNEFNSRIATSENGWNTFVNKITRLTVIFGNALLPALNTVLGPLGAGVDMLANFAEANQGVTAAVGIGVAALIGLKGIMIAGKAASLVFGNKLDGSRLFFKRLNNETEAGGKAAAFAAKQWRSLGSAVRDSAPGRTARGGYQKARRRGRRARRGLGGLVSRGINAVSTPKGLWNPKAAGLSLGGGALAMMPMTAMATDAIEIGGDVAEATGKLGLSRILKPLGLAMNGASAVDGLMNGDSEQAGSALGDIGGSLAGGAAGAAIGTMLFPGIGTALGGLIGSVAGGFTGEEIGGWFGRKLDSPDETAAKVAEVERKKTEAAMQPPMQFSPVITVHPSKGQDELGIAQKVIEQMDQKYAHLMGGNTVSTRLGYAAIDRD
ncbi:phage tail tape measure protein [Grimontia hollisae]|uniref:phage tail tape measure protein n=1 Tax=Grimontia hollisae TaxID=673 RepID=UPI0013030389|nr:phage tail tape measure protein [Grimontia hollisae]